ncbi:MAG: hypothetical protein PHQ19_02630 [Candidatus Krumholzibacteria bacterium]|nr:hypothetical protein [Candidatus Krumholzibacteria bacterium]
MSAEKKSADFEELLATYSAHVSESYPAPERFRENLARMLEAKKERRSSGAYVDSLEKNLVFLVDLIAEGEAYLELVLGRVNDAGLTSGEISRTIGEMEGRVRASTSRRRTELLGPGAGGELAALAALRGGEGKAYLEKLEFDYIYHMTMRLLLFEFFNILAAVREEYVVERVDEAAFGLALVHVEMTANYYLGNISVGGIVPDAGRP